ncbi:unnamed protein product [Rotaria socialis]|uniref:EF-hand domain-containing protein n=1 Tax=Rotaria socialis TaxID=392032 RepID=A0A818H3R7_9BILA|nr:unnamed protein product [Rotaria socialis]CAF3375613.1 unnamed protein product [Rotaria socialis]CAF3377593.1 unnamed protein product [Rotaria socialis]CAF3502006.1 unnamed protein product [Rotaria socialis]CAF3624937.1 unnamed protein product [Rotaria socialis]
MACYYNIPNKVNLPLMSPSKDIDPIFISKSKPSIIIESEKKTARQIKHRHPNISNAKENTPPRRIATYNKLYKPLQTVVKNTVPKPDPRRLFNFIDTNTDSRLSYLEFRSWMLVIDKTLAEHELFQLFNEIDRNSDGFIQYKEFRDYFGEDLLTDEANVVELTALFNEINTDKSSSITLDQLLAFFNRNSTMITEQEARIFLGMVSDAGNENSISLKEFLKAMHEWKV